MLDAMTMQTGVTLVAHDAEHVATVITAFLSTGLGGSVFAWIRLRGQIKKMTETHATKNESDGTRMDHLEKELIEVKTAMKIVVAKLGRLTVPQTVARLTAGSSEL